MCGKVAVSHEEVTVKTNYTPVMIVHGVDNSATILGTSHMHTYRILRGFNTASRSR